MATAQVAIHAYVHHDLTFTGVLGEVGAEVVRSYQKHASESMLAGQTDGDSLAILVEEVGEIARALTYDGEDNLRDELIQLAAMATAWVMVLDRDAR